MSADFHDSDFEPEWVWNTRVTAEAARAAFANGQPSQERFELFEQLILTAGKKRTRTKSTDVGEFTSAIDTCRSGKTRGNDAGPTGNNLSGFEGWRNTYPTPNDARSTIIEKCFLLADEALTSNWTFHKTNEALLWFHSVLKIDPRNTKA